MHQFFLFLFEGLVVDFFDQCNLMILLHVSHLLFVGSDQRTLEARNHGVRTVVPRLMLYWKHGYA